MKNLRISFGNKCNKCKKKSNNRSVKPNLEFAHIKDTLLDGEGRGQWTRYKDIKENRKSYKLLCISCHRKMDYLAMRRS